MAESLWSDLCFQKIGLSFPLSKTDQSSFERDGLRGTPNISQPNILADQCTLGASYDSMYLQYCFIYNLQYPIVLL